VELHSISAPDGTEVFFCRTGHPDHSDWTSDFDPVAVIRAPAATGLRAVDHVALTQPWQFFDEATLFYRSALGLEPHDSLELADPYGLLRSRAVETSDGAVRIALNVQPASYDGRHVGATQHVAFVTDDILATARALRECSAPVLHVSGNYYDDLAARHALDESFLAQLQEFGVLYDSDGPAEFLHLYLRAAGEVFFEVVQRTSGYDGYGAANAPYRLAAQRGVDFAAAATKEL
jgi:4-hydroxyphenylpyruvate dioxygenase